MIRTVKEFDRGDHTLIVDTTSGQRVTTRVAKDGRAAPKSKAAAAKPSNNGAAFRPRIDCTHLIGNTGDFAKQTGCGGCGADTISVWDCELYGDVAPLARGTIATLGVRNCKDCGSYQRN